MIQTIKVLPQIMLFGLGVLFFPHCEQDGEKVHHAKILTIGEDSLMVSFALDSSYVENMNVGPRAWGPLKVLLFENLTDTIEIYFHYSNPYETKLLDIGDVNSRRELIKRIEDEFSGNVETITRRNDFFNGYYAEATTKQQKLLLFGGVKDSICYTSISIYIISRYRKGSQDARIRNNFFALLKSLAVKCSL
ncbi:MAG: hypothetical protein R2791_03655 [Saprospiraceae bacterium]